MGIKKIFVKLLLVFFCLCSDLYANDSKKSVKFLFDMDIYRLCEKSYDDKYCEYLANQPFYITVAVDEFNKEFTVYPSENGTALSFEFPISRGIDLRDKETFIVVLIEHSQFYPFFITTNDEGLKCGKRMIDFEYFNKEYDDDVCGSGLNQHLSFKSRSLRLEELANNNSSVPLNLPQTIEHHYTRQGYYYTENITYGKNEYKKALDKNIEERSYKSVDWLLSDTDNFDQLPKNVKENIYSSTRNIVDSFSRRYIASFKSLTWTIDKNCVQKSNPDIAQQYYDLGYTVSESTLLSMYTACDEDTYPGFKTDLGFKELEKSLTWQEILSKYNYDYLKIAEDGISKDNLKELKISQVWGNQINFDNSKNNNSFYVESLWKKGSIGSEWSSKEDISNLLSLHGITDREERLYGTYSFPTLSLFDVYRINKYYNISKKRKTSYKGPKIKFQLDNSGESFSIPLWKVPGLAQTSENFANAIYSAVGDLSSDALKSLREKNIAITIQRERDAFQDFNDLKEEFFGIVKELEIEGIENREFESKVKDYNNLGIDIIKNFLLYPSDQNLELAKDDFYYVINHIRKNKYDFRVAIPDQHLVQVFERHIEQSAVKPNDIILRNCSANNGFIDHILYLDISKEFFGESCSFYSNEFNKFAEYMGYYLMSLSDSKRIDALKKYQSKYFKSYDRYISTGNIPIFGGYSSHLIDVRSLLFDWDGYDWDINKPEEKVIKKFKKNIKIKGDTVVNRIYK